MSLGPFDLTGGPFLGLYAVLLAATVIAGFVIPRRLRPQGRAGRVTDVDQLAYLSGGARRFVDALTARLLAARTLTLLSGDRFRIGARELAATPAESAVLALPSPSRWREIETVLKDYAEPLQRRMTEAGLLMSERERFNIRFWASLPYLMLLAFGVTKWIIGDMRDRPVGFLSALLVVTAIFAIIRWVTVDRRTRAGLDARERAAGRSERLRTAPTTEEIGLAVALFGTAVLVGSGWGDFHSLRRAGGGDGGSSGGCGSDGGGGGGGCGGGGGGCGGCGGG
jgi:uncharacterized protein (TIGR04222 family)